MPFEAHDTTPLRPQGRVRKTMKLAGLASERDFYRYYPQHPKPYDFLSRQPSPAEAHDPPESAPLPEHDTPQPSEDHALTAFAQLGALRLDARRCLISFFDRRNCYILAEGTRTTCLHDGLPEFKEDNLCFGTSIFPKEMSLCHYTVNLPWKDSSVPLHSFEDHPSLIVNDLAADARFKDYPFVAGPPYSRFYAGVPIRSPSGHNIGTYCVLDDKPREGLRPHELLFLKNMATTVMRHLEMSRATEDQRRGKFMVKSLGSFAEGKSGLENWWAEPWEAANDAPSSVMSPDPRSPPADTPHTPTAAAADIHRIGSAESSLPSINSPNPVSPSSGPPISAVITPATEIVPEIRTEVVTKSSSSANDNGADRVAPELRATFDRAANMIVDAVEAEGAVFFDAKISTFGGLVDDDFLSEQLPEPDKPCTMLGAAFCKTNREANATRPEMSMSESILRHLLRTYPHGQIFNLDDDMTSPAINSPSAGMDIESSDGFPFHAPRQTESTRSVDDENYLRTIFPRAKSLVLYPLWDPHRDRWFASALIWTTDSMRVFTSGQELSYLAAFSNSVMAEVARLDTKLADAAKADFISSISHELRSPLHGILGMTDLLKDSLVDNMQSSHIATIETCGKTLLETINHVLDFAKINNLTRGTSKRQKKRTASSKQIISSGQAHTNDIMTLINDVDMAVLTEDVVESVFAGYTYQKNSTKTYETPSAKTVKPPVSIILDINRSANYVFRTQPGAWRRVIMNLFGNSLKYTPAGYIKVKLEVKAMRNTSDELCEFRFTVTDSGIGMSEDYVNNRLFHSFAQENPLSQGTGLGLSIVKQIVESLGGEVEVRSEQGRGTKFTVTCPLKASVLTPSFCATGSEQEKEKQLLETTKRTKGLKVRFVGFDDDGEYFVKDLKNKNASKLSMKAIDSCCNDWFGMQTHSSPAEADLIIATESFAKILRAQHSTAPETTSKTPVVVVCQGAAAAKSTTSITVPGITFECISQPVGPYKMSKALASCLDRHVSRAVVHSAETNASLPSVSQLDLKENIPVPRPTSIPRALEPTRPALTSVSSAPEIGAAGATPLRKSMYAKPTRSLNCLCVDDNPINLRLLRTFVDKLGHKHILAADGVEAFEAYKVAQTPLPLSATVKIRDEDTHIDVILMDINMPRMDGLEATRQIRAHEMRNNLPKVTIIALTGVADSEIQQEANSSGINLFLIKPLRLADLEVVLKGVITGQDNANVAAAHEAEQKRDVVDMMPEEKDKE